MKVREAMAKTISSAGPDDSIAHVATLMQQEDCGFIPVVSGDEVIGCVTDRDLTLQALAEDASEDASSPVANVMTSPVWSIQADADIQSAAHSMAEHAVRRLPVVDAGALVGVLSYGNLEQALHAEGPAAAEATLGVTAGA